MKITRLFFVASMAVCMCACGNQSKIKVACVGDSITEGHGIRRQSIDDYPVVLGQKLGDAYAVQNCGRSSTTLQKEGDFPYWLVKEFSNLMAYQPDIVVMKLGTNDSKPYNWNYSRFANDYQAMIDTIKHMPSNPRILVCTPAPAFGNRWGINDSIISNYIIPIIDSLAKANDLQVIDFYTKLANQVANFPDSIHPNEQAAALMADIVANSILGNK